MYSFYRKYWLDYCLQFVIISATTVWSFTEGETLYFLIPVLLIPICIIQSYFITPIYFRFGKQYDSLKQVDLSLPKRLVNFWWMFELCFSLILVFRFAKENVALFVTIYFTCKMISLFFFLYGLWFIFKFDAKRQGIDLGSMNARKLFADIRSEVAADHMN